MKKLWCVKKILLYAVALVVVGDMRASQRGQSCKQLDFRIYDADGFEFHTTIAPSENQFIVANRSDDSVTVCTLFKNGNQVWMEAKDLEPCSEGSVFYMPPDPLEKFITISCADSKIDINLAHEKSGLWFVDRATGEYLDKYDFNFDTRDHRAGIFKYYCAVTALKKLELEQNK